MNSVTTIGLLFLLALIFFLGWRLDVSIRKSKPLDATENSGRIRVHLGVGVGRVVIAVAFFAMSIVGLSSSEWFARLGSTIFVLFIAAPFLWSVLPWHQILWAENGLEGHVFSWRHPIIPKRMSFAWREIAEVKMERGFTILLSENNQRLLAWNGHYRGYSALNAYLAKNRPDLFYAPYYLEPIPRKK